MKAAQCIPLIVVLMLLCGCAAPAPKALPGGEAKTTSLTAAALAADGSPASPLEILSRWETDRGQSLYLGDLRGKPCVFAMFFATCEGSCILTIDYLSEIEASLSPADRGNVQFVVATFDPAHDSVRTLAAYRGEHHLSDRWTLIRGTPQGTADLARRLSLTYGRQNGGRLVHSNGMTIVDAGGRVVHQQLGLHSDLPRAVATIRQCLPQVAGVGMHE